MTYGQRFRQLRMRLWTHSRPRRPVITLAQRLGTPYPSTVYNIEKQWRVPNLATVVRHAEALGVTPWELLEGVETEYDMVRQLGTLPPAKAKQELERLLARYGESVWRSGNGKGKRRPKRPPLGQEAPASKRAV